MDERENENSRLGGYVYVGGLMFFLMIFTTALFFSPEEIQAFSIFTSFGGKVESWVPEALGCAPITAAIDVATAGAVTLTVEELKVGGSKGGTFGILRINGSTIPILTTIHKNYTYFLPGVLVLGNSINLCDVCGKVGVNKIPLVKNICSTDAIKTVTQFACDVVAEGCPITNLVHRIGSSLKPSF